MFSVNQPVESLLIFFIIFYQKNTPKVTKEPKGVVWLKMNAEAKFQITSSQVVAASKPEQNVLEQLTFHLSQVDINDELIFLRVISEKFEKKMPGLRSGGDESLRGPRLEKFAKC